TIAKALDIDVAPGRFLWDAACGGSQWVSLFREAAKSRSTRYACADAVLIVGDSVRLILEIEEAGVNGFLPTRIEGNSPRQPYVAISSLVAGRWRYPSIRK